jgi:hypothetical protein
MIRAGESPLSGFRQAFRIRAIIPRPSALSTVRERREWFMTFTQEFLVLETEGTFGVYGVRQFPKGTVVGPDARRLRVVGDSPVSPPQRHLSGAELDQWCRQLEDSGRTVTIGPFWTTPGLLERSLEEAARGETIPLKEAFDELCRRADERDRAKDRRLASVEPPVS